MKLMILLSALALTVSSLALMATLDREEAQGPAETPVRYRVDTVALETEMDAIRETLERLSARLDVMESRPAVPARIPAGDLVEQTDLEALRAELLAEFKGSELAPSQPALKQNVAAVLEELNSAKRDAKADARRLAMMAKLDEQMPRYQQELGLTSSQADGLRGVIEARDERYAEMARLWESGDREAAGELKANESETYQAGLQGVLNGQQVEQFNAMGGGRRGGK